MGKRERHVEVKRRYADDFIENSGEIFFSSLAFDFDNFRLRECISARALHFNYRLIKFARYQLAVQSKKSAPSERDAYL